VTVIFADLSGSTELATRLDPEDLRGVLRPFFDAMVEEIERFGGTVEKFIGDAVMAVFGVPVTHEDDEERAVRAALAMQGRTAQVQWWEDHPHRVRRHAHLNHSGRGAPCGERPAPFVESRSEV
jgi:class 3 adenylate cyclase